MAFSIFKPGSSREKGVDFVERSMGAMGLWQILVFLAVSAYKCSIAWHQLSIIFLAPPQEFWCSKPAVWSNISENAWKDVGTLPLQNGKGSCLYYDIKNSSTFSSKNTSNLKSVFCDNFDFDVSTFSNTIVQEWNLVCKRAILAQVTQMIFMFGGIVGCILFGFLSDKYGRKYSLLGAIFLELVAGVSTAFTTNFIMFQILRFIDAMSTGGGLVISFVLVMEITGLRWRSSVSILFHAPFALGHISMIGLAYAFRNWRHFQLAISLPVLMFLAYNWVIPESPRWLVTAGRIKDAKTVLKAAAKRNNMPEENVDELVTNKLPNFGVTSSESSPFLQVLKQSKLRKYSFILCFACYACGSGFFGLNEYISKIGGNVFFNTFIGGLTFFPAIFISIVANELFGRKKTVVISLLFGGLLCLLIVAVPVGQNLTFVFTLFLSCVGLLGIEVAFFTFYLYSGEIFPTEVRNIGVGSAVMSSRFGAMIAPLILYTVVYGVFLPPLVFGVTAIFAGLFSLLLPETKGKKLPNCIEEINCQENQVDC